MNDDYRPRLSVDIPQKHYDVLKEHVPFGMLKPLVGAMVEDLVNILDSLDHRERGYFLGSVINRSIRFKVTDVYHP